jgi:exodeoxyribonuclease VII large subunit
VARSARALLLRASPALRVAALRLRLEAVRHGLAAAAQGRVSEGRRRFELAARTLHTISPLATLDRGYAIVTDPGGTLLRDSADLRPGAQVAARLARGRFTAQVVAVMSEQNATGDPT